MHLVKKLKEIVFNVVYADQTHLLVHVMMDIMKMIVQVLTDVQIVLICVQLVQVLPFVRAVLTITE